MSVGRLQIRIADASAARDGRGQRRRPARTLEQRHLPIDLAPRGCAAHDDGVGRHDARPTVHRVLLQSQLWCGDRVSAELWGGEQVRADQGWGLHRGSVGCYVSLICSCSMVDAVPDFQDGLALCIQSNQRTGTRVPIPFVGDVGTRYDDGGVCEPGRDA